MLKGLWIIVQKSYDAVKLIANGCFFVHLITQKKPTRYKIGQMNDKTASF